MKIDDNVYSVPDITANELREYYSFVNINNNYTYEFMNHKNHEEIFDIIFPNGNTNYNKIFKINELEVVRKTYQYAARKFHCTYDSLVRFESAIQEILIKSDILVTVILDIAKAYDLLRKHAVLTFLKQIGLKGDLPRFIKIFLQDRKIKVKIGATL